MAKIRKQVYLEKKQNQQLKRLAETRGVSEAEVIRQAIEHEAEAAASRPLPPNLSALEEIVRAARARRQLGITGAPYKWNREDAYEERLDRLSHRSE